MKSQEVLGSHEKPWEVIGRHGEVLVHEEAASCLGFPRMSQLVLTFNRIFTMPF